MEKLENNSPFDFDFQINTNPELRETVLGLSRLRHYLMRSNFPIDKFEVKLMGFIIKGTD